MKKYTIFSLIFISLIGLLIYTQDNSYTTLPIFGINISLPNAVWVSLFILLFFIFSLLYFTFVNIKNYFFRKNIENDIKIILENIKNRVLYVEKSEKVKKLALINNFIQNIKGLSIIFNNTDEFPYLEEIKKLMQGEVVNLDKYKLKDDNPWVIKNLENKLNKDNSFAKEILKSYKNEKLRKKAFYIFAKTAPAKEILKFEYPITLEILISHIKDENLIDLVKKAKLTPREEIIFAKEIFMKFSPDKELEILSPLPWGKAYLAFKYEHLELAKEIIEENNLKFFEFFLKLRECQKVDIDEYINSKF